MTDYKAIERAAKIVEHIKKLDEEIIQIDKMAIQITNNNLEELNLCIKGIETKQAEEEKKPILDENGSLINQNPIAEFRPRTLQVQWSVDGGFLHASPVTSFNKQEHKIEQPLKERLTLKLLTVLLLEKQQEREDLISQLSKISIHA